jgi:hypothetical protein
MHATQSRLRQSRLLRRPVWQRTPDWPPRNDTIEQPLRSESFLQKEACAALWRYSQRQIGEEGASVFRMEPKRSDNNC